MAAGFSGCGQKSSVPDTLLRTAIAVSQKGAVTVYLVEDFERDYYSLQELQEMAEGEVTEFYEENPSEEEKAVVLESVEETGENRVKLIYQYADWTAYEKFNENVFFYGTLEEAKSQGISEEITLQAVSDGRVKTLEELEKEKKARLLVTDVNADIYCKGRVLYASEGAARKEDGSFSAEGTEALYLLIK